MKRKIILIFSIVLLVFSLSLLVGQKVVSSRLNNNSVSYNVKKEEKTTNKGQKDNEDEINNEETEDTVKEEQEIENAQEKEVEKKTETKTATKTNTKAETKTNTDTKKNTNVKDNSNTTITSSNKNSETNKTETKTETIEESEVTNTRYGVKFLNVKKYQVTTYSDGTVDKKLLSTYKSIDKSGYNATAADLKDEATKLVDSNWNKYVEVLGYVNTYRGEKGVSPLTIDRNLCIAATVRALEMAYTDKFSHERPNMSGINSCFTVLDELSISRGYATGENIAAGYSSPKAVSEGWRNSPGHYANMIDARFSKIGIGMAQLSGNTYGTYWAQLFVG